jgi:peptidoglycan/LPS O-acetylase OafA/YrhL
MRHYRNLDWLRLCFALSVPIYHVWNQTAVHHTRGLFGAVPAFLALSGFVVLESYERSKSTGHFFWKRVLRVTPAFLTSFALVAVLFGSHAIGPAFKFWLTFGISSSHNENIVLWSLSCEEVAYVSLAIAYGLGVYKRPILLWLGLAATFAIGLLYSVHSDNGHQVHNLPCSFLIGNLFYVYRDRLSSRSWIPLVAMIALLAFLPLRPASTAIQFAHQSALIASFIWFGIAGPQIPTKLPVDLSYGTYVYHFPILMALYGHGIVERWTLMGLCLGITLPFALASWLLIEKAALGFKDRLPRFGLGNKPQFVGLAVVAAARFVEPSETVQDRASVP